MNSEAAIRRACSHYFFLIQYKLIILASYVNRQRWYDIQNKALCIDNNWPANDRPIIHWKKLKADTVIADNFELNFLKMLPNNNLLSAALNLSTRSRSRQTQEVQWDYMPSCLLLSAAWTCSLASKYRSWQFAKQLCSFLSSLSPCR